MGEEGKKVIAPSGRSGNENRLVSLALAEHNLS